MEVKKKRRPFIALLLSLLTPALGQLYNGQLKRAILLYLMLIVLSLNPFSLGLWETFNGMVVWLVSVICFLLFVWIDALYNAIRLKETKIKTYNRWYFYLIIILMHNLGYELLIKPNLPFNAYKVPAASMKPTLLIGDRFIVNKAYYKEKKLLRHDVVVFRFPEDPRKDFVKRIIGLPGEVVKIRNKQVYVNGKPLNDDRGIYTDPHSFPMSVQPRDNFGPVIVPENSLFVMGDNRDHSYDSRFWGFLDISEVKGKVLYIYWSKDWDRIGRETR